MTVKKLIERLSLFSEDKIVVGISWDDNPFIDTDAHEILDAADMDSVETNLNNVYIILK